MKKLIIYMILSAKNLIQQLEGKKKRNLSVFFLIVNAIVIPVAFGMILYPVLKFHSGLFLLIPIIVILLDIDKAVYRVKYSEDMKQLHNLKFSLFEYIIAKDLSKYYTRITFIFMFLLSFFMLRIVNHDIPITVISLEMISFIMLLMIGYCMRIYFILFLSLFYKVYVLSIFNYFLLGSVSFFLYLNYKFHIFSTQYLQHPILYNILALTLYLIILWLIRLPFRHLHRTSIQQIYDSHKSTVLFKRRGLDHKSVISNSKVKYELLLLIRNPPVSIGVILLMVALSMGLFGVMIFIIENNNDFTNYKNSALAYPLVMLPGIITSYMIQPFVSFDLDGKMMQLKKNNDVFILNKIVVKEIISLIFNLILFGIYLTLTLLFLKKPFSLLSMIIVFFSYVLISISIVTSTIAFPNFKWNFFYEIPSTLSKILLAVVLGGILLIGIAGVLADGYFSILVIITQIILIIFLLMINRSLWKKTIHKNFFSFRLLRE